MQDFFITFFYFSKNLQFYAFTINIYFCPRTADIDKMLKSQDILVLVKLLSIQNELRTSSNFSSEYSNDYSNFYLKGQSNTFCQLEDSLNRLL